MSGEYSGNVQFQQESIAPGGPFVFSIAPENLKTIVRNSELAKQPLEPSSVNQPENLYERLAGPADWLTDKHFVKQESAPGEFTGRNIIINSGESKISVFQLDNVIGQGDHGIVYLCHDPQGGEAETTKCVAKIQQPERAAFIKGEIEALKLHVDDDPPIVPKYFGDGTVGERLVFVMEFMQNPTILERLKQRGWYSIGEALNAVSPFLNFLSVEERRKVTAIDFKLENVRAAYDSKGQEYFRYLDYGAIPDEGIDQNHIKRTIGCLAGLIYFTAIGRNPSPFKGEEFSLKHWKFCMDMSKHIEFRSLPIGFQAIMMKGLGFLEGGYNSFTDFNLDIALLARSLETQRARVKLPDYQPSDFISRAISASVNTAETSKTQRKVRFSMFQKQKIEPSVSQSEQLAGEMEKMMLDVRPVEVIETESDKRNRLKDWRKFSSQNYVCGGIAGKHVPPEMIASFDKYLSMFPDDREADFYRDILSAIDVIYESGISDKDDRFHYSYSDYLNSLTISKDGRNELLPFDKLKESAQPLIELANKLKLMAEVSDSGEPPIEEVPELTLQELTDVFLANGLALDGLKRKSANGSLTGLGSYSRQTALDFIGKAIDALEAMESRGVKFINVAGDKIPIGQIRLRVKKDLDELSS